MTGKFSVKPIQALPYGSLPLCMALLGLFEGSVSAESPNVERTVRSADGYEIAYEAHGASETGLIFIHGWACDRTFWSQQLAAFSQTYRVVALDLAGHGHSRRGNREWSVEGMASDVEAVVRAEELHRLVLVGHSMGGVVAVAAAPRLPEMVIGIVGVDTLHDFEEELPEAMVEQVTGSLRSDFGGTMRGLILPLFEDPEASLTKSVIDRALASDPEAAASLIPALQRFDIRAAVRRANVPIRCINAAPGRPGTRPTEVAKNRKYGDFSVELMDGVGHFLMQEKPRELNQWLAKALASLEEASEEP